MNLAVLTLTIRETYENHSRNVRNQFVTIRKICKKYGIEYNNYISLLPTYIVQTNGTKIILNETSRYSLVVYNKTTTYISKIDELAKELYEYMNTLPKNILDSFVNTIRKINLGVFVFPIPINKIQKLDNTPDMKNLSLVYDPTKKTLAFLDVGIIGNVNKFEDVFKTYLSITSLTEHQ